MTTLRDVKVWQAFRFINSKTGWVDPKVRVRRSRLQYSEITNDDATKLVVGKEARVRIWFTDFALPREVEILGDVRALAH